MLQRNCQCIIAVEEVVVQKSIVWQSRIGSGWEIKLLRLSQVTIHHNHLTCLFNHHHPHLH